MEKENRHIEKHLSDKELLTANIGAPACWAFSIAVNAIIAIAIFRLSEIYYETNDDYSIACKIVEGYPFIGFVNYYYCSLLIPVQRLITSLNVFVLSQIVASFFSFIVLFKIIVERKKDVVYLSLNALLIAFFSFDHYSSIQFTKTAALLMCVGLIVIADAYIYQKRFPSYILGYLLFFTGTCYRQMGMFPALAYILGFMLIWWAINGKDFFAEKRASNAIAVVLIIVAMLIAPYGFDKLSDAKNASTPELSLAREYQAERIKITDYPLLDYYDQLSEEYEKVGISENDLITIDRFILDYDGAASLENLKVINSINSSVVSSEMTVKKATKRFCRNAIKSITKRNFTGIHLLILAVLSMVTVFCTKPRTWAYVVAFALISATLYITIYYMQRVNYRAFYVADVSAAFWLVYVLATEETKWESNSRRWIKRSAYIIAIVLIAALFPREITLLDAKATHNNNSVASTAIEDYLKEHKDHFYIMPTSIQKWPRLYLQPLKMPYMQDNCTNTGGWETMTPSRMDFMANHGVSNPIKDLIDNPQLLLFGKYKTEVFLEYYNKWYGSENRSISFEKVDEVDGIEIFKVISIDRD